MVPKIVTCAQPLKFEKVMQDTAAELAGREAFAGLLLGNVVADEIVVGSRSGRAKRGL
jgi:hypothetical protein